MIAKGYRFARVVLHQSFANCETQLIVNGRALKLRDGESGLTALQPHHFVACRCELFGDNTADHAKT